MKPVVHTTFKTPKPSKERVDSDVLPWLFLCVFLHRLAFCSLLLELYDQFSMDCKQRFPSSFVLYPENCGKRHWDGAEAEAETDLFL